MTEHKYAQVLRWIADGKKVQWNGWDGAWHTLTEKEILKALGGDDPAPPHDFRLAPRTVKVGDVEIEAPLTELNGEAWYFEPDGSVYDTSGVTRVWVDIAMNSGMLFSTKEAAEAAHAAWVKLMRGDA